MKPSLRSSNASLLFFALVTLAVTAACQSGLPRASGVDREVEPPSTDWTVDMARFAAEDAARPPAPGQVVFTGSSSMRLWPDLARDFPGVAILNRGFGGSQIRDAYWHADQVALRYRPRQVLLYAGDNDIDAGRTPAQVLADVQTLVARLRAEQPGLRIGYVSIKPSPLRLAQWPRQREANALVRDWAGGQAGIDYIDIATPMLGANGRPDPGLFVEDGLHLNARGYALWRTVIAPFLAR